MSRVQFIGQSSRDPDNVQANPSRLVNCYIEPVGGRSQAVLKSVLGQVAFADLGAAFTRAAREVGGMVYVANDFALHRINPAGEITSLGVIEDDEETTISSNDGNITVVAGGKYYLWDGTTLTEPTAGAFSDFGSVTYFGSLTVLTERNGNRVQWSDVYDPATLGGLSFATADAYDGDILRAEAVGSSLWVFKAESMERWYQVGADLAPVPGGAIQFGLKAFNLFSEVPNGAFFVGSDNKVRILSGGMKVISNRAVETSVSLQSPTGCFFYQDEGHDLCVITFAGRAAWAYDMATGAWHERSEGNPGDPWRIRDAVKLEGDWIAFSEFGAAYKLERSNSDVSGPLIREAIGRSFQTDSRRFRIKSFEVQGRMGRSSLGLEPGSLLAIGGGFTLDIGDGAALLIDEIEGVARPAKVELSVSRDFGETFGDPKDRSMGIQGEYDARAVWRSLGQFRSFTPKITWSDAEEITIDAEAFLEIA